jgi:hypothetical protein
MKVLITENKRYQLAYKILDDILDGLTREVYDDNKDKGWVFSNHQIFFRDKNNEIAMWYSENHDRLEVNKAMWVPLKVFSFNDEELERIIFWWFKDRVRIEPDGVYLIGYYD